MEESRTTPPHLRVSVVIPHLNQPDRLNECLASLSRGQRRADEIVVVDNGSRKLPRQICAAHPGVTLLQERTPGPGPARNLGIAHTTGDILAFIDADCVADPLWLAVAEREMRDPAAEILGGDVRIALVDPARPTMIEAYESIYAYRMDRYIAREGFTGTGNLVVRRRVIEAVGPFAGLSVAEDRDWGQRATQAGHALRYVADMKVYHPAREDFAQLKLKWGRHMDHDFEAAQHRPRGRVRWIAKMLAIGFSPLAEVPRIVASDRVDGARARFLAFAGLTRIRLFRMAGMGRLLVAGRAGRRSARWNR